MAPMNLDERFATPLPHWIENINEEAEQKIISAPFMKECRDGNVLVMRALIIGLWPFVDEFPKMLHRGCWRLLMRPSFIVRFRFMDIISLFIRARKTLEEIKQDEETHRTLWLITGEELGLIYPEYFQRDILPETRKWMQLVDHNSNSFAMFMRFTAIEIIAEAIGKNLVQANKFTSEVGKRGIRWFKAHVYPDEHRGLTHEELAIKLGFIFHPSTPTRDECNAIIQEVVDIFLVCAEACRVNAQSFK